MGINEQLRRAVISISSNIAEGGARSTSKDQAHFYTMAYGSLMEVLRQLLVAVDLEYVRHEKVDELRKLIAEGSNKLNALKKAILKGV